MWSLFGHIYERKKRWEQKWFQLPSVPCSSPLVLGRASLGLSGHSSCACGWDRMMFHLSLHQNPILTCSLVLWRKSLRFSWESKRYLTTQVSPTSWLQNAPSAPPGHHVVVFQTVPPEAGACLSLHLSF